MPEKKEVSKQEIILNKYMAGVARILPSGQLDVTDLETAQIARSYKIGDDVAITKADVAAMKARKKAAAEEVALTPENLKRDEAERKKRFIRCLPSENISKYDINRAQRKADQYSLYGERATAQRESCADDLKKLSLLNRTLNAAARKVSYDPEKIPASMTPVKRELFDKYLSGKIDISVFGYVNVMEYEFSFGGDIPMSYSYPKLNAEEVEKQFGFRTVTAEDAELARQEKLNALKLEGPQDFWERKMVKGRRPNWTGKIKSSIMGRIASAVIRCRMEKTGADFEKRRTELDAYRAEQKKVRKLGALRDVIKEAEKLPDPSLRQYALLKRKLKRADR
jgi:hypothetical protein